MKTLWKLLFILLIGSGFYAAISLVKYSTCDNPISYRLGEIDKQFNISDQEFSDDVANATQIWDKASDKQLFTYNPKADLSVNLVYDSRQALTNQIQNLESQIDTQKGTIDQQIAQFESDKAAFEKKVADLNSQIAYWNQNGGAPSDVYDKLIQQQRDLKAEAETINQTARTLNQSTVSYNSQINTLDQTINTFNQSLTFKPEEGLYDGRNKTITIYFANNKDELVHTLAHELGHAIGLNHNLNQNSIMFSYSNTSLTPTEDDLKDLTEICRKKSIAELSEKQLTLIYHNLRERLVSK